MFVGYPQGTKGYKLYDIQNKRFFVSRNVIFHENIFLFHQTTLQGDIVDLFPDLVLPKSFNYDGIPSMPIPHVNVPNPSHDPAILTNYDPAQTNASESSESNEASNSKDHPMLKFLSILQGDPLDKRNNLLI